MTAFVVDASIAVAWLMPDESDPYVKETDIGLGRHDLVVPPLFDFEVRNIVVVNERRGRIDRNAADAALTEFDLLPYETDHACDSGRIVTLARKHGLTVYDAAYLELALRRAAPLATLDHALRAAAAAEGMAFG
jgi:predicted nucleic acid-binding protein